MRATNVSEPNVHHRKSMFFVDVTREKTHTACTVSIPERSIQFLILLVQQIVKDYLRLLRVSSPYDTDEAL